MQREIVAPACFEIVEIVRGGDLHYAGAEFGIGHVVQDYGDFAIHKRKRHLGVVQVEVALVAGVDGYGGIAQHGFGAGGRGYQEPIGQEAIGTVLDYGITDVPEVAGGFLVHGFEIGDGGLAVRAPVDHVLAAVEEAFFVEADEGFAHGSGEAGVEGEAFAGPVAGSAELDHLLLDGAAGFGFPLPDARFEGFAAHGAAVEALFAELALDDHLSGDAGVVHAGQPERDVAGHAVPADGDVDFGVLQHVAHMERAGYVGGRDDEGEDGPVRLPFGAVNAAFHPPLSPARLEEPGLIYLI